ncbi:MAG: 2OG-Fe(II) oxygenase [Actinomycetota bacterium]
MGAFLDHGRLARFSTGEFLATRPFPFVGFDRLLREDAFATLLAEFPDRALFTWHGGIDRVHGQRPHNRWYLAYESARYDEYSERPGGVARRADLPPVWAEFIDELTTDPDYLAMISTCLGRPVFETRFAWHLGVDGSEVSPHVDDHNKAGTHIFYFNTDDDWRPEWGGRTEVLSGKTTVSNAPNFDDFAEAVTVPLTGNASFFFRNQPDAWHGVRALHCPEHRVRRLFNVIYEHPGGAPPFEPAPASRSGADRPSLSARVRSVLRSR